MGKKKDKMEYMDTHLSKAEGGIYKGYWISNGRVSVTFCKQKKGKYHEEIITIPKKIFEVLLSAYTDLEEETK